MFKAYGRVPPGGHCGACRQRPALGCFTPCPLPAPGTPGLVLLPPPHPQGWPLPSCFQWHFHVGISAMTLALSSLLLAWTSTVPCRAPWTEAGHSEPAAEASVGPARRTRLGDSRDNRSTCAIGPPAAHTFSWKAARCYPSCAFSGDILVEVIISA